MNSKPDANLDNGGEETKTKNRMTQNQKDFLLAFLRENESMINKKFSSTVTQQTINELWVNCVEKLNSMGPPKPKSEWKRSWNAIKRKVKHEASQSLKKIKGTGGGDLVVDISPTKASILAMTGGSANLQGNHFTSTFPLLENDDLYYEETIPINEEEEEIDDVLPLEVEEEIEETAIFVDSDDDECEVVEISYGGKEKVNTHLINFEAGTSSEDIQSKAYTFPVPLKTEVKIKKTLAPNIQNQGKILNHPLPAQKKVGIQKATVSPVPDNKDFKNSINQPPLLLEKKFQIQKTPLTPAPVPDNKDLKNSINQPPLLLEKKFQIQKTPLTPVPDNKNLKNSINQPPLLLEKKFQIQKTPLTPVPDNKNLKNSINQPPLLLEKKVQIQKTPLTPVQCNKNLKNLIIPNNSVNPKRLKIDSQNSVAAVVYDFFKQNKTEKSTVKKEKESGSAKYTTKKAITSSVAAVDTQTAAINRNSAAIEQQTAAINALNGRVAALTEAVLKLVQTRIQDP